MQIYKIFDGTSSIYSNKHRVLALTELNEFAIANAKFGCG